jgi:quercetin dioxygenase-like cupin family protein
MTEAQLTTPVPFALRSDDAWSDILLPPSGGRWMTKIGAEQSGGRLLQLLATEARGASGPLRLHNDADQSLHVLDGRLTVFVGDEQAACAGGDFVLVPRAEPFTYVVTSEQARFVVTFSPAGVAGPSGVGLDGLFREVGTPVVPAGAALAAPPDPEEFARIAFLYGCEIAGPPPSLEEAESVDPGPTGSHVLTAATGMTDVWWPYGPCVGHISIEESGERTDGRLLQLVIRDGRGAAPPMHVHHDADESFYVLDGEMTIFVGDQRIEAGPGDFVFGPMGVRHAFLVTSERAEFLVTYSPAGTPGPSGCGVTGFFRDIAVPVQEGEPPPPPAEPDREEFARRAAQYGIEIIGPPPTLD